MSRASRSNEIASPNASWATRVTSAASKPPVTASGMFQRRSGAIQRLRPAPTKKTTIEIVNVRKPGVSMVVVIGPNQELYRTEVSQKQELAAKAFVPASCFPKQLATGELLIRRHLFPGLHRSFLTRTLVRINDSLKVSAAIFVTFDSQ